MEFWPFLFEQSLRRERVLKDPNDPLAVKDKYLIKYYRFPRHEIINLCNDLRPYLERRTRRSHSLPVHKQVLTALLFYSVGGFQCAVADALGISQVSVSRIIDNVSEVLFTKAIRSINMPRTKESIEKTKQRFLAVAGFPDVMGAIDCTHVPMKSTLNQEELYLNKKNVHTLNIQVVCDSYLQIINFVAKNPGSTHKSIVWRNSNLCKRFESEEFGSAYLLGDTGYSAQQYVLTPFHTPLNEAEVEYNKRHKQTHYKIKQVIVLLKSRFRCLHVSGGSLQYNPTKCAKIVGACMFLHNRCISRKIPLEDLIDNDDPEEVSVGGCDLDELRRDRRCDIAETFL